MGRYLLSDCSILTPLQKLEHAFIEVEGPKIASVIKREEYHKDKYPDSSYDRVFPIGGRTVCPGFIDIHNHGAMGINFSDLQGGSVEKAALHFASGGTASFLLTPGPLPFKENIENLGRIKKALEQPCPGARAVGINMEGPYLNPKYGAQKKGTSQVPEKEEYEKIIKEALPYLKVMTVAPELPDAMGVLRTLSRNDVIASIGHTEASGPQIELAVREGARLITHIFNAMGQPVQKEGGVKPVGTEDHLIINDSLMAEVMADRNAAHVDPVHLKILVRVKGIDNIILITDSLFPAGLQEGLHEGSDGRRIVVYKNDVNRLEENGFLAGSVMSMNMAVKNMINHTGIGLIDAVKMATVNPARLLGIDGRKGSIKEGMDADITVIDDDINVILTIVEGRIAYDGGTLK